MYIIYKSVSSFMQKLQGFKSGQVMEKVSFSTVYSILPHSKLFCFKSMLGLFGCHSINKMTLIWGRKCVIDSKTENVCATCYIKFCNNICH